MACPPLVLRNTLFLAFIFVSTVAAQCGGPPGAGVSAPIPPSNADIGGDRAGAARFFAVWAEAPSTATAPAADIACVFTFVWPGGSGECAPYAGSPVCQIPEGTLVQVEADCASTQGSAAPQGSMQLRAYTGDSAAQPVLFANGVWGMEFDSLGAVTATLLVSHATRIVPLFLPAADPETTSPPTAEPTDSPSATSTPTPTPTSTATSTPAPTPNPTPTPGTGTEGEEGDTGEDPEVEPTTEPEADPSTSPQPPLTRDERRAIKRAIAELLQQFIFASSHEARQALKAEIRSLRETLRNR